jgi:hypothetical protein
MSPPT